MAINRNSQPYSNVQPAQQTSLGTQGHGLLPKSWFPNTGLILRSSLPMLPDDACTVAQNFRWNGKCWTTDKIGWKQQRGPTFGNGPMKEMAKHWLANGEQLFVMQAGTQVMCYDPTLLPLDTEVVLFTAMSETIPCMRSYAPNYFLYCNGVDYPQKWNGTKTPASFQTLTCFPFADAGILYDFPDLVENFMGRAAWSGFPNDRYAILLSNFLNPEAITINNVSNNATYGGIFRVPSQCGPVTTIKALQLSLTSNQQALLVGCTNGFAIIYGTSALDFQMIVMQSDKWGIPSNRCWVTMDTTAFALCTDGIRPFSGNAYQSNLVNSCVSFPIHPIITGWNWTGAASQAFAIDNPDELEATFYFSSGGDIINRTALIMNYADITSGLVRWSTKEFPNMPSGGTQFSPACGIQYKQRYWAGGFDQVLQELYASNTWNGTGIKYRIGSPLVAAGTPAQEASSRGFYIMTEGDSTKFTAEAYTYVPRATESQGMIRRLAYTQELSYNTDGTTGLGTTFELGSAQFGGPQYNLTPFNPPGGGRGWEFQLTGDTSNGNLNLIGMYATLIGGGTRQ